MVEVLGLKQINGCVDYILYVERVKENTGCTHQQTERGEAHSTRIIRGKPISEAGTCRVCRVRTSPITDQQSYNQSLIIARKESAFLLSINIDHGFSSRTYSKFIRQSGRLTQVKETPPKERRIEDEFSGLGLVHKIRARDDITTPPLTTMSNNRVHHHHRHHHPISDREEKCCQIP